jgi:uncharacterized membrane-anchored protein
MPLKTALNLDNTYSAAVRPIKVGRRGIPVVVIVLAVIIIIIIVCNLNTFVMRYAYPKLLSIHFIRARTRSIFSWPHIVRHIMTLAWRD